jgi:hypothetical protein
MATHSIEPGQRLRVQVADLSGFVHVIAAAIVPADYWVCREESSGQQRVIARTALFPIATDLLDVTPAPSPCPAGAL